MPRKPRGRPKGEKDVGFGFRFCLSEEDRERKIKDMEVSLRTHFSLTQRLVCNTVDELSTHSVASLLKVKGIGKETAREIEKYFSSRDLNRMRCSITKIPFGTLSIMKVDGRDILVHNYYDAAYFANHYATLNYHVIHKTTVD